MNQAARDAGVIVIGPATVGGIAPGAFKIANVGGTIENIINSKLHRAGSCGLVTRSGGLFNELSNIISINADGIAEGVAIGGDRFVGSVFIDNLLRMQENPQVKYMVLLGEVGGTEEYKVIEAVKSGRITKPIIAIKRKPSWKISLLCLSLNTPPNAKIIKPTKPPNTVEFVAN